MGNSGCFNMRIGITFELAKAPEETKTIRDFLSERRRKRIESLAEVLRPEDDLGKVVSAHIHIEHELQELIFLAAPNPTQLKPFDRMEYSEKVQLALVLGLNAELKPALSATGNLRNKFSHRLDRKFGADTKRVPKDARKELLKALALLGSEHAAERASATLIVERRRARLNLTWDDLIVPAEVENEYSEAA